MHVLISTSPPARSGLPCARVPVAACAPSAVHSKIPCQAVRLVHHLGSTASKGTRRHPPPPRIRAAPSTLPCHAACERALRMHMHASPSAAVAWDVRTPTRGVHQIRMCVRMSRRRSFKAPWPISWPLPSGPARPMPPSAARPIYTIQQPPTTTPNYVRDPTYTRSAHLSQNQNLHLHGKRSPCWNKSYIHQPLPHLS